MNPTWSTVDSRQAACSRSRIIVPRTPWRTSLLDDRGNKGRGNGYSTSHRRGIVCIARTTPKIFLNISPFDRLAHPRPLIENVSTTFVHTTHRLREEDGFVVSTSFSQNGFSLLTEGASDFEALIYRRCQHTSVREHG